MSHRHRASAILLIATTIAAASIFAILVANFQMGSSKQLSTQINCPDPCLITITAQGFGSRIVVARGTSVLWRNMDSISHSISAVGNWSFDTGMIQPGQTSKSILLNSDGTFDYYCKVSMIYGEITVTG